MEKEFFTIKEAADYLGKSTQTVRRMLKKGDLKAQKIKTPQGFHYILDKDQLDGDLKKIAAPKDTPAPQEKTVDEQVTSQENLTSQTPIHLTNQTTSQDSGSALNEAKMDYTSDYPFDYPTPIQMELERERAHYEKMRLISIIEHLQKALDQERRRPRSLLGYIVDWFMS